DSYMLKWANDMAKSGGKVQGIRSFKDPSLGSGVFLLDVLNGMKSNYVDYSLVTGGRTDEEAYLNAKLSISIARKMGATIWFVSRIVPPFLLMVTANGWRIGWYPKISSRSGPG